MPFSLHAQQPEALTDYLRSVGLLDAHSRVLQLASAGEGNMNLTLRATCDGVSLIVKQARPWVRKYPHIAAPTERAEIEATFYATVAAVPHVSAAMPSLLHHDSESHLLVLEDVGEANDFSDLYSGARLTDACLPHLLDWLAALHAVPVPDDIDLSNLAMRKLNHEHMFDLPFRDGVDLGLDGVTAGLAALAHEVSADAGLVEAIEALGDTYLEDGPSLVHGDFYPGSWLRAQQGLRVIDPEFAFLGPPAFDYGVLAAHLLMSDHAEHSQQVFDAHPDARGFAGVEVLRRLLGVAQLPLTANLAQRRTWAAIGAQWVRQAT